MISRKRRSDFSRARSSLGIAGLGRLTAAIDVAFEVEVDDSLPFFDELLIARNEQLQTGSGVASDLPTRAEVPLDALGWIESPRL